MSENAPGDSSVKTIFVIFGQEDVARGDVDKLIGILLSGGQFSIDPRAAEADGSVKLYVTGPSNDMDAIIEAFLSGRRTVWLGQDPATQKEIEHA